MSWSGPSLAHVAKILDKIFIFVIGCTLNKVERLIKKELTREIKARNQRNQASKR